MSTAKEEIRRMLDDLPEEASFEDLQYQLYVRHKVAQGLKDIEEGRVFDQDEVERRMQRWLKK